MAAVMLPSPQDIQAVVEEEMAGAGGKVMDCLIDDCRMFLRGVLPSIRHVRTNDPVQGGVAVIVGGAAICAYPYTYRQVCWNGAIMVYTIGARRIQRVEDDALPFIVTNVLSEVRQAVQECSAPEVFSAVVDQLRTAAETKANPSLHLLPLLSHMRPSELAREYMRMILARYSSQGDDSVFGLINAVTSVARDESDPQVRWDLEELGGGIPAMLSRAPGRGGTAADVLDAVCDPSR